MKDTVLAITTILETSASVTGWDAKELVDSTVITAEEYEYDWLIQVTREGDIYICKEGKITLEEYTFPEDSLKRVDLEDLVIEFLR